MAGTEVAGSLTEYARRRCLWWVMLSVLVTSLVLQYSLSFGRLSADITFDDITYFNDGVLRLDAVYTQGFAGFVRQYRAAPPHSPFSSLLAAASFALFGLHDWAPHAGNLLLVLVAVAGTDCLLRRIAPLARALCLWLLCTTPLVLRGVEEFRPDIACGLFTALGVVSGLRGGFSCSGWKRQALVGLLFGLALLIKPTAFPFTLLMLGVTVVLAGACDALAGSGGATFRNWFAGASVCGLCSMLVALPHFALDWKHVLAYIQIVLWSPYSEEWRLKTGQPFSPWFHITGEGGAMMLGWHLFLFGAAWLAGLAVLVRYRRTASLLRLAALALAAVPAVVIPTRTGVVSPFFGASFHWLVVFAGLEGIRSLFLGPALQGARRPVLATLCVLLLAVAAPAISFFRQAPPQSRDPLSVHAVKEATAAVFNDIRQRSRWRRSPMVFATTSVGSTLHGEKLVWRGYKEGFLLRLTTPPLSDDPEVYRRLMATADFILACVPTSPGAAPWLDSSISGRVATQTLELAREDRELREVGCYPVPGNGLFYLFERRPSFGGWRRDEGLGDLEGPYPQCNLPEVIWGNGPATRLEFDSLATSVPHLRVSCCSHSEGQAVTVLLDGKQIGRYGLPKVGQFVDLDLALPAAAGSHAVTLQYAVHDRASQHALLFRRLALGAARPPSAATPLGRGDP